MLTRPAELAAATALLAAASWVGVLAWRPWARRWRLIDIPNDRSSHTVPTPRAGGVPMVVLTLGAIGVAAALAGSGSRGALALLVSAATIAVTGFVDDIHSLGWSVRLAIQLAMAGVVIWGFGAIHGIGPIPLGLLAIPLTAVWVAGLTNAYNFMDGIDGIAGMQAVVAGAAWAVVGALRADLLVTIAALAIAATAAGFLGHNWPPAKIFMGDVASGFLGFLFAALTVRAAQATPAAAVAGALFVWPFLFDTTLTFFRRLWRRENIVKAHRSHLYQRLTIAGATHRHVSTLYGVLALLCAAAGVAYERGLPGSAVAAAVTAAATAAWLLAAVRNAERR